MELTRKHGRERLAVNLRRDTGKALDRILTFLSGLADDSGVLNVAGPRESKSPDIQRSVAVMMVEVISKVNGGCFYPPPSDEG